ncbi:endonuclease domain-containing protein [uncultured Draconibacterium sp.]|uniref:endonuclease domain-containing protein n=1 Tax=uncultured Draconibacterium sp. TaxID=1573823 RepID=UPI0029C8EF1F|nr:endonuclease domain-containing protein [uncultured Draconibacterium sp.]
MSNNPNVRERARILRRNMTKEETKLWQNLRGRKFFGLKFLRQHPITYEVVNNERKYFIPDFYCAEKAVIIEIDGKIHQFQQEKDKRREDILKEMGFRILRIRNEEFIDIFNVLEKIENFIFNSP